jgi:hypothetical protein
MQFVFRVTQLWWTLAITRRKMPVWASVKSYLRFLFVAPGMFTKFLPHWLQWFKPGYHPDTHYPPESLAPVRQHIAAIEAKRVSLRTRVAGPAGAPDHYEEEDVILLGPSEDSARSDVQEQRQGQQQLRQRVVEPADAADLASAEAEVELRARY